MLKWFSNNLKWLNNPQMYVCLILALVFWGVNRLNGMYTSDITIPVTISGVGDNDLIIDESQLDVKLKIKANGYTIMFFKVVSPQSMFDFSVADIELERSKDSLFFEISHTSMRNILQQKFGSKAEIIDVQNNSLTVGAKRYRQKTLPIIPRLSLDFGGEFMQVGKTVRLYWKYYRDYFLCSSGCWVGISHWYGIRCDVCAQRGMSPKEVL